MRPVLARVVADYCALRGVQRLHLVDIAEMNDALDVQAENDRRAREAAQRNHG
jgi:hypothetical protein